MRTHQNAPGPKEPMLQQPSNYAAMFDGDIGAPQRHGSTGQLLQSFARAVHAAIGMPLHQGFGCIVIGPYKVLRTLKNDVKLKRDNAAATQETESS